MPPMAQLGWDQLQEVEGRVAIAHFYANDAPGTPSLCREVPLDAALPDGLYEVDPGQCARCVAIAAARGMTA